MIRYCVLGFAACLALTGCGDDPPTTVGGGETDSGTDGMGGSDAGTSTPDDGGSGSSSPQEFSDNFQEPQGEKNVDVGDSCDFSACGGDPVGTWKMESACVSLAGGGISSFCEGLETKNVNVNVQGMWDINDDMTYHRTRQTTGTIDIVIPGSCLTQVSSFLSSCSQIGTYLPMFSDMFSSGECIGEVSDQCECRVQIDQNIDEEGTWEKDGDTTVVATPDDYNPDAGTGGGDAGSGSGGGSGIGGLIGGGGGDQNGPLTVDYCVDGDTQKANLTEGMFQRIGTLKKQ